MKWEYFVKDIGIEFHPAQGQSNILNHYGKEGWELVSVQGSFAYFKRPIQNETPKSRGGYTYDTVEDGYAIYGPPNDNNYCEVLPGWKVVKLLNEKKND